MARDRKDRSVTSYMERHGGSLLRLAHVRGVLGWRAAHNVLAYPKQIPDGLLEVTFAGRPSSDPFLIEIETYPDRETLDQIRRDLAIVLLARGVVPDILLLVLLPKGNLRIEPEQIAASAHGLTEMRLRIHTVNLWTLSAEELLAADDVGLIPWVPLTRHEGSPRALLSECRDRIEEHAAPDEKEILLSVTRTMAEARYNNADVLSILGEPNMSLATALLKLPAGQRLIAQKERAAEKKGELANARKYVLRILRNRFGKVPKNVTERLRAIKDQDRLDQLLDVAGVCADLGAFRTAMGEA
ncbi:MAG: hypothetical protein HYR84_15265 [Planctomycetes bacterium]|nr:hypothetical protein [Planctomycetota bacterium]